MCLLLTIPNSRLQVEKDSLHIIHRLLIDAYLEQDISPNVDPEAGILVQIGGWIVYPGVI